MAVKPLLFPMLPLSTAAATSYRELQILWISVSSVIKEEVSLGAVVFKPCLLNPRAVKNQQVLMQEGRRAGGTQDKDTVFSSSSLYIDLSKI